MGLHADIGTGLASALATATGVQCEYGAVYSKGANESRSLVMPSTYRKNRRFEDTAHSAFGFDVLFDLLDRDAPHTAATTVMEGIADALGEVNGSTLFAAITDSGSNIKASTLDVDFGTPRVEMDEPDRTGRIAGDADRPRITVSVSVECWHTHPLT